jgi:hypothetical protein
MTGPSPTARLRPHPSSRSLGWCEGEGRRARENLGWPNGWLGPDLSGLACKPRFRGFGPSLWTVRSSGPVVWAVNSVEGSPEPEAGRAAYAECFASANAPASGPLIEWSGGRRRCFRTRSWFLGASGVRLRSGDERNSRFRRLRPHPSSRSFRAMDCGHDEKCSARNVPRQAVHASSAVDVFRGGGKTRHRAHVSPIAYPSG